VLLLLLLLMMMMMIEPCSPSRAWLGALSSRWW
jgi:hypothetical protein